MRTLDLLVKAGCIYTVDEVFSNVEAMAIDSGRVVALGKAVDLEQAFLFRRRLSLGKSFIYPGFMDPHAHFLSYGLQLERAQLLGSKSWEEAVERLKDFGAAAKEAWVIGRGWDQNLWLRAEFPDRALLDAAFPQKPAVAFRVDGHAAMANAAALAAAGIDGSTRIEGGVIVLKEGRLSGLLLDKAVDRIRNTLPKPGEASTRRALRGAQAKCFEAGLTSVSNAGTEMGEALLMERMLDEGELSIGIYVMLMATEDNFARFVGGPLVKDRLSVRSFKTFADGALGSRGAFLLEPYADDPGNRGIQTLKAEDLDTVCAFAAAHGFQVNSHAIGDAALRLVIDVYEEYLKPGNALRWRIEHAQLVHDEDLPRFGRLGIIPSVQTTHATSDMAWTETRLGPARMGRSHRYHDLLSQNGWLANGSDFPFEGIEPLRGFCSAVFRKDDGRLPDGGYRPGQALSRVEALKAMTIWAARANFEESGRGSLGPGKWADFTVLDIDLLKAGEEKLWGAKVLGTFVAGNGVFRHPNLREA
ncbi:MAG: amidohydrolase [Spirochaetes bacterium]|nr:amidohydrolase [Spirochaetota bacterium]